MTSAVLGDPRSDNAQEHTSNDDGDRESDETEPQIAQDLFMSSTVDSTAPAIQYVRPALTGAVLCLGVMLQCLSDFFKFEHIEELRRI